MIREVVTSRGVWSGFFVHAITLLTVNAFLFLWGVPSLTDGHGLSPAEAGTLLTVNVVIIVAIGSATCAVGFDLARTAVSSRAIGTATGLANMGAAAR